MLIETKRTKEVEEFLKKDLIINLNIFGILNNKPNVKIFVDNLDTPNGVLVNDGYFNYIYSQEESFIREVIKSFEQKGEYGFSGIKKSIADMFRDEFDFCWISPCILYYLPKENLDLSLIKNPARSIDIKDAEIIDTFYTYRDEESINRIKEDILKRPSSAIYIDGEPVSWVLTHEDNSIGIMYTKEEYRKNGYAVDLTVDISSKHIKNDLIPFLHIVTNNTMSPGLAKKCGFVEYGEIEWFGIEV